MDLDECIKIRHNIYNNIIGKKYKDETLINDVIIVPTNPENYSRFVNEYYRSCDWAIIKKYVDVDYAVIAMLSPDESVVGTGHSLNNSNQAYARHEDLVSYFKL